MNLSRKTLIQELADDAEKGTPQRVTSDFVLGKWIIGFLKDFKLLVILAFVLIIVSAGASLVTPYLSAGIIDQALGDDPGVTTGDAKLLLTYCLALGGIAIVLALVNVFKNLLLYYIGHKSVRKIRANTFSKLQSFSMKYFDNNETGQIISRVTNDCNKVNELMSGSLIVSITDLITVIGVAVFLIVMNWELGLITIAVSVPPIIIISYIFKVRSRRAYRKTRKTIANVTSSLSESIDGIKVSQSFTREKKNIKDFRKISQEERKASLQAEAIFAATYPILNFLASAVVGFVYLYAGWTINKSGSTMHLPISMGEAIAFTQYIGMFFNPILNLTLFYNTFQSTMAATERIYELNHTVSEVEELSDAYTLPKIKGSVVFDNVTFAYINGENILENFSLAVKAGESVAIVGPTGSGKTTIMNLLARFYEIQEGSISIDDHDIRKVTLESLHSQMGIVLQDPFLFSGTIKENISYGNPNVSQRKITQTAKMVNVADFIKHTPDKYDTEVGEEGKRLSVGQRQLISFARAIIINPRILILDEATSSVDSYTEMLIKNAMNELLKNRTSFIIAHRLSTIRSADRIIVIKKGKIVEEGSNEELLALKGEYYKLYQLQFKEQENDEDN